MLLCGYYDLFLLLQEMSLCFDGNCIISADHFWQYGIFAVLIFLHMIILGPFHPAVTSSFSLSVLEFSLSVSFIGLVILIPSFFSGSCK